MNWIIAIMLTTFATGDEFVKPVHILADARNVYTKPHNPIRGATTYKELAQEAIFNCRNANWENVNEKLIWQLIDIERKYNLPSSLRGMLLAAACHESGYNPNALGDRKFSKKRIPKAVGLFQMWSWWEKSYKIDRRDPLASAEAYMKHVTRQLSGTKRKCKYRKSQKTRHWLAAWATAIRAPKKNGRCGERPKFYKILKKWHKEVRLNRKAEAFGC
jgi:hypothetical protein